MYRYRHRTCLPFQEKKMFFYNLLSTPPLPLVIQPKSQRPFRRGHLSPPCDHVRLCTVVLPDKNFRQNSIFLFHPGSEVNTLYDLSQKYRGWITCGVYRDKLYCIHNVQEYRQAVLNTFCIGNAGAVECTETSCRTRVLKLIKTVINSIRHQSDYFFIST